MHFSVNLLNKPIHFQDNSNPNIGVDYIKSSESSKNEECWAICALHGVLPSAPLPSQLIAIDKEYKNLLANGKSQKADHVMALYAWRAKQAVRSLKFIS